MDYLDLLQWPAMLVTITAAWLIGSRSKQKRTIGFWVFLVSNLMWGVWGWHQSAYALILLQVFLALMNARGVYKNDPELKVTASAVSNGEIAQPLEPQSARPHLR